jgi:hypothetical protein
MNIYSVKLEMDNMGALIQLIYDKESNVKLFIFIHRMLFLSEN